MNRFLLCVLCVLCGSVIAADAPPSRPNILFVFGDQWRAQALGYAGDTNVKTPHLDALEKQSVDFTRAISTVPVCCPMRATLQTGQYALTHGVFMNDVPLDPNATSLGKTLAAAGYDTGYVGKWHINEHGRSAFIPRERRQGYEYWKVLECTHNYNNSFYYADTPEKLKWDGYDAIAQTKDVCQYLRDHAKQHADKPFAMFLSWGPPHSPYMTAPQKYRDMYDPAKITLRHNVLPAGQDQARKNASGYYAHCTALDDCIGDLLNTLKETGQDDNTVVVFTADHGDMLGSHDWYNKQQPYDESARVPLLFRLPARMPHENRRATAAINTEDLMPTLLGLAGVAIPNTVQGRDYSKYIQGKAKDPGDGASLISCPAPFGQWNKLIGGREYRAIRTDRYTYVRDLKGPWLLFDNETDPYQMTNLVNKPQYATLQSKLDAALNRKLKEFHDDFRPATEYIEKWGYKVSANGTVPYTN